MSYTNTNTHTHILLNLDEQRRLKSDEIFQQMGLKKASKKEQRPSFIRVLQSLQDDGFLDQAKVKKEPTVMDAETLRPVKKSTETHEYVTRMHENSKYEYEKAEMTKKLYKLGHALEKKLKTGRNPSHAGSDTSPAVRAFWKHTNCSDSQTARHFLKISGWDINRATKLYFQIEKSKDDDTVVYNEYDDDEEEEEHIHNDEVERHHGKERKFRSTLRNTFEFMKTKLVHPTDSRLNLQTTLSDDYLRNGKPYKSLLAMRHAHSAQILNLVNQEEQREKERQRQLKYTLPKNRKRLMKRFETERRESQMLIQNVRADNETSLAKRMIDMGLLR